MFLGAALKLRQWWLLENCWLLKVFRLILIKGKMLE